MALDEQLQFAELDISHLKGRIDALSSLCALLIATHPRASKIIEVFKARASEIDRLDHPTEFLKAYAEGFTRLAYDINAEEVLKAFHEDELKLFPVPKSGGH